MSESQKILRQLAFEQWREFRRQLPIYAGLGIAVGVISIVAAVAAYLHYT